MDILIGYLVLGIATTLLIMLTQYFKSKSFGELTSRNIIERFIGWILLWPFLVFHTLPRHGLGFLFEKHDDTSFDFSASINERENELFSIWENPPSCSDTIVVNGYDESTREKLNSKFTFQSDDVAGYLNELSPKNEFSVLNQDAILLKWVSQRDESDKNICLVPEELDRFNSTANSLLFKGVGRVFCEGCQAEYTASQLDCVSEKLSAGWNFDRVKCSNGHLLSVAKGIHLNCRTD